MLKRTLQFVGFLLVSIVFGLAVTLITSNLENMAGEKKLKHEVKVEIKKVVSAFRELVPGATPGQTTEFLRRFIASTMKDKVIAVARGREHPPGRDEAAYLFTFKENKEPIDIYIENSYIRDEVYGPDWPDFIQGVIATTLMFTGLVIYSEKKRQALQMRQHFETKHAELRKALEEHEALALLGRMAATLAHELKTPIATISNLVHVLPSRIDDERFLMRFDVLVKEELNRTRQLIDNLLAYGKEITVRDPEWIGLKSFIGELSERAGVKPAACPDLHINADRFYIRLLFENLIRNSAQAGATEISVKSRPQRAKDDPLIDVLFEDNGRGFPGGCELDELIPPFVTRRPRGAGLGLFLVQRIALAHGGALSLYRTESGAGIKISLPRERVRLNG